MTSPEAPAPSRRALRRARADVPAADPFHVDPVDPEAAPQPDLASLPDVEPVVLPGSAPDGPGDEDPLTQLGWGPDELRAAAFPYVPVGPGGPRPPRSRRGLVVTGLSILAVLLLAGGYVLAALLWPVGAIPPTLTQTATVAVTAPAAAPAWPATGTAAVAVDGLGDPLSSSADAASIASITKVVTALLVLDRLPLAPGESGPEYAMTAADRAAYRADLAAGESTLDVPVGASLSELQLLQGMLIGSANNYAERLSDELWGSDRAFADAARAWLAREGLAGITIVDPTGIEEGNAATAAALVPLARRALADPVVSEIVSTREITLPGAGLVTNTNDLLGTPGVVGVKTGTLDGYNLLAAQDVAAGSGTVRIYAATLGLPNHAARSAATRTLLDSVAAELRPRQVVAPGAVVGRATMPWGASSDIVASSEVAVTLWNGATATPTTTLDLGTRREAGSAAGTLTATGSLGEAATSLYLASDLPGPDPLWRLTHPLALLGL